MSLGHTSLLFALTTLVVFCGCGTTADLPQLEPGLHGQVFLPKGEGPFPAMVIFHGSGGIDEVYSEEAELLAGNGIAGLVIDYYSDVGQGGGSQEERARRWSLWQDKSIRAFDYLRGLPEVDSDRVGLMGFSQGGALAVSIVPRIPDLAVLVNYFGPNIDSWYVSWWIGYKPESYFDDLAAFPPTIILHGSIDMIVPISNSRNFLTQLQDQGRVVEFHEFKGQMHAFNDPGAGLSRETEQSDRARELVLDFLDRYLGDPAD